MKKCIKVCLIVIGILALLLVVDLVSIYTRYKPIFAIEKSSGSINKVYIGIFYDTYNCMEYSIPQIKSKFTKFACSEKIDKSKYIESIVDTSIGDEDFSCAMALEEIYKDDDYVYSLGCIKSSVIIVTYNNGEKENIKEALNKGNITINDLDRFNISYIKEEKYVKVWD